MLPKIEFHFKLPPIVSFVLQTCANMAIGVDHIFSTQWPSYWGDKTSTLDWCEENYLYSQYIAEFCKN